MIVEHERDYRGTRLEWPAVMSVSHYTLAALSLSNVIIDLITVRREDMEHTAIKQADLACTEALTLLLGQRVGQAKAFAMIHRLSQDAIDQKRRIRDCALENKELALVIDRETIDNLFDPSTHIGSAGVLVDRVLATRRAVCGTLRGRV
jgi:adenylosuccinate lyase